MLKTLQYKPIISNVLTKKIILMQLLWFLLLIKLSDEKCFLIKKSR